MLYAAQYERPDYDQMLSLTLTLLRDYHKVNQIFIDSSAPEFISGIKRALHERPDYLQHIEEIKRKYPNSWQRLQYSMMRVQPVAFSINHKRLLSNAKQWLDDERSLVAIPSKFESLLTAIRTATAMESTLDKSATINDDLYDAFRLSMNYWIYEPLGGAK